MRDLLIWRPQGVSNEHKRNQILSQLNKKRDRGGKMKIDIPDSLYTKLEAVARSGGWKDVESLIIFLLRKGAQEQQSYQDIPEEEKEEIRRKLKELGYL